MLNNSAIKLSKNGTQLKFGENFNYVLDLGAHVGFCTIGLKY